jgi:hypothetical protein
VLAATWALLCVAMATVSHSGDPAPEAARVEIGFLTCNIVGGQSGQARTDAGFETDRELLCTFTPTDGRPEETYIGTFQSVAGGEEVWVGRAMVWTVKGRLAGEMAPGL